MTWTLPRNLSWHTLHLLHSRIRMIHWRVVFKQWINLRRQWRLLNEHLLWRILYCIVFSKGQQVIRQSVQPKQHRENTLVMVHSTTFEWHMGMIKTTACLHMNCYWPDITKDIENMCRACKGCQFTRPEGKFIKALIQVTDISSRSFEKIAMDFISPLRVASDKDNCRKALLHTFL